MQSVAVQSGLARAVDHALGAALRGDGIACEDALLLIESADTDALCAVASVLRDRSRGRIVSYSRKVFIPLTHLCRDYCGYCTFRSDPTPGVAAYMTPGEVLAVAEAGARAGCKEALFSLGDQPEQIFPQAAEFLRAHGFSRTLEYLAAMSELVLRETGLLPHSNPGLMRAEDMARLKRSNVSMGLMLESTSLRLRAKGAAHWRAPDKAPALRLRTIEEAGRQRIAFTTGILIGIGETLAERVDSLFAIAALHRRHGHIQEVLVQPFRAKPDIRMASADDPSLEDLRRTIAVARMIMPELNIQSPPNLVRDDFPELLMAGINDFGGISPVTKDFINPEAAWPQIAVLQQRSATCGFELRERLAIYPEFARSADEWTDAALAAPLQAHLGPDFYARM